MTVMYLCLCLCPGCSTRTLWPSSGTLSSVSTLACRPIRSAVDTPPESWATSSPRNSTISTCFSSKGAAPMTPRRLLSSCIEQIYPAKHVSFSPYNGSRFQEFKLPLHVCRFRLVPFLVELRAVMDWVWTDTTLSLSNWMCVEDIYANIFIIKCSRETEKVLAKSVWEECNL